MIITEEKLIEVLDQIQGFKNKRDMLVDTYNDKIETLSSYLENLMGDAGKTKIESQIASAYYRKNTSVKVDSWPAVLEFVQKNSAFDIIQKRISPVALKARLDAGDKIKGVSINESETFIVQGKSEKKDEE